MLSIDETFDMFSHLCQLKVWRKCEEEFSEAVFYCYPETGIKHKCDECRCPRLKNDTLWNRFKAFWNKKVYHM